MDGTEASSVWKRQVLKLGSSAGASKDLMDLLQGQGSHALYVPAKPDWPDWLVQSSTAMSALPRMVLDRYQNRPQVCFFNALPEIGRAWASIDNSLFLWKLGQKEPVPAVYNSEEQPICCVGLARPVPGVFLSAIQHVLVVCTTVEIVLVGVCFSDGTVNGEILLTALTGYSIPSDNVTMCSMAATSSGRIFLGGADGHVYEIIYGKNGRMRKACQTTSFLKLLPSYIPYVMGITASPVEKMVVDDSRNLLYALSHSSAIQLFHLGKDGRGPVHRIAEVSDFQAAAQAAPGGNQVFRPSEKKRARVVHVAVIPPHSSARLHMVAVTEDARRVFFTTYHRPLGSRVASDGTPNTLKAELVWGSDGLASSAARLSSGGAAAAQRPVNIERTITSLYTANTLLLAERATDDGSLSKILCAFPNPSQLPASEAQQQAQARGAPLATPRLSEVVTEAPAALPGEVNVIAELPQPGPYAPLLRCGLCDERQLQLLTPPPRVLVMSTAGVVELTRHRPLEALQALLLRRNSALVRQFFLDVGAPEACALCFMLATPSGAAHAAPADVVLLAEQCLSDVALVGFPEWRSTEQPPGYGLSEYGSVTDESEPEWSSMHKGLCVFVYRMLYQVWESPLLSLAKESMDVRAVFPMRMLELLQLRLLELARVVERVVERMYVQLSSVDVLQGRNRAVPLNNNMTQPTRREPAFNVEQMRTSELRQLALRAAEALLLVRKLTQHHVVRLLHSGRPEMERSLSRLRLCELLTAEGQEHVKTLLLDLLKRHIRDGAAPYALSQELLEGCATFFPYQNEIYLRAFEKLTQLNKPDVPRAQQEAIAHDFLATVREVPAAVELSEAAPLLAKVDMYESVVQLAATKAEAKDPSGRALLPGPDGEAEAKAREANYADLVTLALGLASSGQAAARQQLQRTLAAASAVGDKVMLHTLFRNFIAHGHGRTLVQLLPQSEELQRHLLALGTTPRPYAIPWNDLPYQGVLQTVLDAPVLLHLRLLAELYAERRDYGSAVEAWAVLGQAKYAPTIPVDQRPDRAQCFQSAVLHAKMAGDEAAADVHEADLQLALLQQMTLEALRQRIAAARPGAATDADTLAAQAAELEGAFVDVSTLFNTYAKPNGLWVVCLLLLQYSQHDAPGDVRQVWDLILKDEVDSVAAPSPPPGAAAGPSSAAAAPSNGFSQAEALRRAAVAVQDLALRLYPSAWFPEQLILTRLLQTAAGLWPQPHGGPAPEGAEIVTQAMLAAMQQRHGLLVSLFEALLCRSVALVADAELTQLARHPLPWSALLLACRAYTAALRRQVDAAGFTPAHLGAVGDASAQEIRAFQDMLIVFANQCEASPSTQQLAADFRAIDAEARTLLGRQNYMF